MKKITLVAAIIAGIFIIGIAGWSARFFFLQNKVIFLLNQHSYDAAAKLLSRLEKNDPDSLRTKFLQVKTLTIEGQYERAIKIGNSERLTEEYPESLYWRAIAEYQNGDSQAARRSALRFLREDAGRSNMSANIAAGLTGDSDILKELDNNDQDYLLLFPVEKAIYTGFIALQQARLGRLDSAAETFNQAFLLGNRNQELLYEGTRVCALVGHTQDAKMFFDFSDMKEILPIFESFERMYRSYRIVSLTLHNDDLAQGGRKIDVARALAWAASMYLREDPVNNAARVTQIMSDLLDEYPFDVVIQVRKAGILAQMKRYDASYAIYRMIQPKFPNYTILVRMSAVEGVSEKTLTERSNSFMDSLDSATSVPLDQLQLTNGVLKPEFVTFHKDGSVKGSMTVTKKANHILMIVARGDQAVGMWPLVKVFVDGKLEGLTYVSNENWDCYTLSLPLDQGVHTFELVYDNDKVTGDNPSGMNRSFYLRAMYLAVTGVADVR